MFPFSIPFMAGPDQRSQSFRMFHNSVLALFSVGPGFEHPLSSLPYQWQRVPSVWGDKQNTRGSKTNSIRPTFVMINDPVWCKHHAWLWIQACMGVHVHTPVWLYMHVCLVHVHVCLIMCTTCMDMHVHVHPYYVCMYVCACYIQYMTSVLCVLLVRLCHVCACIHFPSHDDHFPMSHDDDDSHVDNDGHPNCTCTCPCRLYLCPCIVFVYAVIVWAVLMWG